MRRCHKMRRIVRTDTSFGRRVRLNGETSISSLLTTQCSQITTRFLYTMTSYWSYNPYSRSSCLMPRLSP